MHQQLSSQPLSADEKFERLGKAVGEMKEGEEGQEAEATTGHQVWGKQLSVVETTRDATTTVAPSPKLNQAYQLQTQAPGSGVTEFD